MNYREVMEIFKKYPYSNNLFITGKKVSSNARKDNTTNRIYEFKNYELPKNTDANVNDSSTNQR